MHPPSNPPHSAGSLLKTGNDETLQILPHRKNGHVSGPAAAHELLNDYSTVKEANLAAAKDDVEIWEGARMVAYVVADETGQTPSIPDLRPLVAQRIKCVRSDPQHKCLLGLVAYVN